MPRLRTLAAAAMIGATALGVSACSDPTPPAPVESYGGPRLAGHHLGYNNEAVRFDSANPSHATGHHNGYSNEDMVITRQGNTVVASGTHDGYRNEHLVYTTRGNVTEVTGTHNGYNNEHLTITSHGNVDEVRGTHDGYTNEHLTWTYSDGGVHIQGTHNGYTNEDVTIRFGADGVATVQGGLTKATPAKIIRFGVSTRKICGPPTPSPCSTCWTTKTRAIRLAGFSGPSRSQD